MAWTVDDALHRAAIMTGITDEAGSEGRLMMDGFINDAILKTFQKTHCVVTNVTVGLQAGLGEYELDRGVLHVLEYAQTTLNPSAKISVLNAADLLERRFLTGTGSVRYFGVLGGNILIVSPAPDGDQDIIFYAVPVPDAVATDDDIFDTGLPVYAQKAVECYLYARLFEQQRDYKNSAKWDTDFERECGEVRVNMRKQAGTRLPAGRIGYPDRYSAPSRNDTYTSL